MIRPMKNQETATRLQQHRALVTAAQAAYEASILDALDSGEAIAAVARASGASRTTIYALRDKRSRGGMPPRDSGYLLGLLAGAYAYELHIVGWKDAP